MSTVVDRAGQPGQGRRSASAAAREGKRRPHFFTASFISRVDCGAARHLLAGHARKRAFRSLPERECVCGGKYCIPCEYEYVCMCVCVFACDAWILMYVCMYVCMGDIAQGSREIEVVYRGVC